MSRNAKDWINHFFKSGIVSYFQYKEMIRQIGFEESEASEELPLDYSTNPVKRKCKKKTDVGQFMFKHNQMILGLLAVSLVGLALIYLVASNWPRFNAGIRLLFIGMIIIVGIVVSTWALMKEHRGLMEGAAWLNFFIILTVSALISQTFHTQTSAEQFLIVLLPMSIALTLGFKSKLMWYATSLLFIVTSAANNYRYWYLIMGWCAYEMIKQCQYKESHPSLVGSVVMQNILLIYGVIFSFRESPVIVMSLLTIIALIYERVFRMEGMTVGERLYKFAGHGMFLATVGPAFAIGFGNISPVVLLTLFGASSAYIWLTVKSTSGMQCTRGIRVYCWYFPVTSILPVAITLGAVFTLVHPLVGAITSLCGVIIAYIWAGNKYEYARYTTFGTIVVVYLTAIIVLLTEGEFVTRSFFAGVTGIVLLLLIWGMKHGLRKKS